MTEFPLPPVPERAQKNKTMSASQSFFARPITIGILVLIALIPLIFVSSVIRDRIQNEARAINGVQQSWAQEQSILGPLLILPYSEKNNATTVDTATNQTKTVTNTTEGMNFVLPEQLLVTADWAVETRQRGIYKIPVYTVTIKMKGHYDDAAAAARAIRENPVRTAQAPYIAVSVTDIRGITGLPTARIGSQDYTIQPGSRVQALTEGFHIPLDLPAVKEGTIPFEISFTLKGLKNFYLVPAGGFVRMTGQSNWPHPSFQGQFLPDSSTIQDDGFKAEWQTGILATDVISQLTQCLNTDTQLCPAIRNKTFGVSFFQPVNVYTQSLRAVQYGILFISLTFAVFYVAELRLGTRVNAMQYLLVGLALAIFYLLLVSLSEIFGFLIAYLTASAATIGLLTFYASYVLKTRKRGLIVCGVMTILYGVLYLNLSSEDYALLIGSSLLFVSLATIMALTRNIDWEKIEKGS